MNLLKKIMPNEQKLIMPVYPSSLQAGTYTVIELKREKTMLCARLDTRKNSRLIESLFFGKTYLMYFCLKGQEDRDCDFCGEITGITEQEDTFVRIDSMGYDEHLSVRFLKMELDELPSKWFRLGSYMCINIVAPEEGVTDDQGRV